MSVPLTWSLRATPLVPRGLCARGDVATRLVERLLDGDDAALARLEGVAGAALVCLRGATDDLPWVPGVVHLGAEPANPGILLPTLHAPDAPLELVRRALSGRAPAPFALLPDLLVPLAQARPLERASLVAWRTGAARAG